MKIKTSELEGAALDWAVAKATGYEDHIYTDGDGELRHGVLACRWAPSADWREGGPLLDCHARHMEKYPLAKNEPWVVWVRDDKSGECGDTLLIAAMRAIVASGLGDTVDVPEELLS